MTHETTIHAGTPLPRDLDAVKAAAERVSVADLETVLAFVRAASPVSDGVEFTLRFRPANEPPSVNDDHEAHLLLNPCDGFHIAYPYFEEDGTFEAFRFWASSEDIGTDFYVAWARLPDELSPELRAFERNRQEVANG